MSERMVYGGIRISAIVPETFTGEVDHEALMLALEELAVDIDNFIIDEWWRLFHDNPLPAGVEFGAAQVVLP